ncbi:MAG TPA: choice-of-anchor L domain-containing protein, partial [Chitinophagaceae bacterium]|nr:choice-of-anchor L domain-containing protein [Chitinophagaceae bacterium]
MNCQYSVYNQPGPAKLLFRQFMLLLVTFLLQGYLNAQQLRNKFPERKPALVNKAAVLFQNQTRPGSLSPRRTFCDFTLTPVNATTNPLSQIIQSLVGSGITISNVESNLPSTSDIYGSFSCGSAANLGMESGLLLTTGVIGNAKGPNTFSGISTDNGLPDTSLLDPLTGVDQGFDATVVGFDIVSNTNTITFQYVFASDEYNEFVNAGYNDVFGFFISGPGITGSQNIAVLPNTTTTVTIDNINNGLNSQYYLDNETQLVADAIRFANIEYDGLTVVLTATATVVPNTTYRLTLAIQDVGDGIYDSGVFIKGGSITSGAPTIACPANQTLDAGPGACSAVVSGIDPTVSPQGTAYNYTLSGATTGSGNGTASGQTYNSGTTTVTYKITDAPSISCSFTVTVNTNVVPTVTIVANPANTICAGTNVTFTATPTNGGTPSYQWKLNGNNVGTNSNTYSNNA